MHSAHTAITTNRQDVYPSIVYMQFVVEQNESLAMHKIEETKIL